MCYHPYTNGIPSNNKYLDQIHTVRKAVLLPLSTNKKNKPFSQKPSPVIKSASLSQQSPSSGASIKKLPWWQRPDVYLRPTKDNALGHMGGAEIDFGNSESDDKKPKAVKRKDV